MKSLLLLIFVFLLLPPAFSQKLIINEIGFVLKVKERDAIEKLANYEARIYNGLFDTRSNDSLTITLNLYGKFKDYKKVRDEVASPGVSNTGFYSPGLKEIFIYYQGSNSLNVTLHEMSHSFLHRNMTNPPKWLNEGLAEFFSTLSVEDDKVGVSTLPFQLHYVKDQIASGHVNLKEFFKLGDSSWSGEKNKKYMYSISYSIVHFMISSNPRIMKKFISMTKDNVSIEVIFKEVYDGLDRFESAYRFFYKS